jgi:hypothetical protein
VPEGVSEQDFEPGGAEPEVEWLAAEKARAARERLEGVDDGTIYGPTRAEVILALLWAVTLTPLVGGASLAAGGLLGPATLARLTSLFGGHSDWQVTFAGTAFVVVLLVALLPKARSRRLEDARVLVFERSRGFGPHVLFVVLLLDLGGCSVLLGH